MAYLYRFTCKPNWPVLSEASILFYLPHKADCMEWALAEGKQLLGELGAKYTEQEAKVVYLGKFDPEQHWGNGVISYETGEY